MKKIVFLMVAVLLIVTLAGCGGGSTPTDKDGEGNGNGMVPVDGGDGGNGTDTAQWAAWVFDETIEPSSGGSGKIDTFTIESAYSEDGKLRKFRIEGTYLGKEMTQIKTQKMVIVTSPTYSSSTENVSTTLECYKVKHRVTVVTDETGEIHPVWADVILWIPTGELETTAQFFWIYPKATYVDSDGQQGEWSYYLTDAMQAEMNNPPAGTTVLYSPVVEGDFHGYDDWAFYGLYGWGWYWFKGFAEGGQQQLQVGSWSYGGCNYSCTKGNKTIGAYTFSAWTVDTSCAYEGSSGSYKGTFSSGLPVPIYLKVASSGEGSSGYFEYTLTDLKLK
ncbi:MAG: hypothetical protein QUS33_00325 [Dehalococcoidia bacterium]|nr:hypothetical protein [Dehalococcoidia bacterium]